MRIADWGPQFQSRKLFDNQVIMSERPVRSQAHEQQRHSGKHATAQTWSWAIMVPYPSCDSDLEYERDLENMHMRPYISRAYAQNCLHVHGNLACLTYGRLFVMNLCAFTFAR